MPRMARRALVLYSWDGPLWVYRKSVASGAVLQGTLQLGVTTSGLVERNVEINLDVGSKTYTLKDLLILAHGDHLRDIEPDWGLVALADTAGIVLVIDLGTRVKGAQTAMGALADERAIGQTLTTQGGHFCHTDRAAVAEYNNGFGDGLMICFKCFYFEG